MKNKGRISLVLFFVGSWCPLISIQDQQIPQVFNLYQLDIRLFLINTSFIVLLYFAQANEGVKRLQVLNVFAVIWVLAMALICYLKSTSGYPLQIAQILAEKPISYSWGWLLMLSGTCSLLPPLFKKKAA